MANDQQKKAELTDQQQAALNAGQTVTVSPNDPNTWPDQDPSKRPGYQEFPRMMYHQSGQTKVVASEDEMGTLGEGWGDTAVPEADEAKHDAAIRAQKLAVARKTGAEATPAPVAQVEVINQPTSEDMTRAKDQQAQALDGEQQARQKESK
ncbi:MAG TPA: hypothetical protein VEL28_06265 [Candidatus Binatia bacterium]|nr:hypothetical protein [Candidatus Binatia bacterium]